MATVGGGCPMYLLQFQEFEQRKDEMPIKERDHAHGQVMLGRHGVGRDPCVCWL